MTSELTDVRYEVRDGFAEIVLDRPEKLNAIRPRTLTDLDEARERAEGDDDVRAILIAGAGDGFSAGADLSAVRMLMDDQAGIEQFLRSWHGTYDSLADTSLPTVACVDGRALAGGLELVLVCDLAVASPDARFGDQHVNVNLIPGGGGSQRLPRIVGRRRAKELMLTGETISAETAVEWGLANRVEADPRDATRELARRLADHHPVALARAKELVDAGMDLSLEDGLGLELETAVRHLLSDAAEEGLEEFLDR